MHPMLAGLLHFKFLSDFPERVDVAVAGRQYHGDSREYRAYSDGLASDGGLVLRDSRSIRYEGPDQLVALDMMQASDAYLAFLASLGAG